MPNIIILAGGIISSKLGFLRSRCPSPALIPINTRPLAAYLIDFYINKKDCNVHLMVNEEVIDYVRSELGTQGERCHLHPLNNNAGVVDSLAEAISIISTDDDLIVNLVTTIPTQIADPWEVLMSDVLSRSTDWSGIRFESGEPIFSLKSKPGSLLNYPFTGVFRCKPDVLGDAIKTTVERNDLLAVVAELEKKHSLRYTKCEWIDCGHETNYYESKAKLISSRSFNRIQVSLEDGVLRKSSQDVSKLERETEYVQMLPANIGVFFPRVIPKSNFEKTGSPCVQTEYYGYPTVAEYLLYWDLSSDNWRRLFSRLKGVLQRFKTYAYELSESAHEDFYLAKTSSRVETYMNSIAPELREVLQGKLVINDRVCHPFWELKSKLEARLKSMYKACDFCIMHGDFCFSNILYDVPSGIVRLIDPRGSFGDKCVGIYGDQKYDLAKLKHSAEFGYDFIVNGHYTFAWENESIRYDIASRERASLVRELARTLTAELGYDNSDVDLITSLLFLSMCPLHAEDTRRQLVMYVHGLHLLNCCLVDE